MFKVILLDDELEVRNRLSAMIDFNALGFQVEGLFENGFDVLEYVDSCKDIDLIITDIKMPFMDGLELVKILKEKYPLIKTIVITGYDEFDYAKIALENGVIGYIMKPVTEEELTVALNKAKTLLEEEKKAYENIENLELFKKETNAYLRHSLLNNIIEENSSEWDKKTLDFLNIDLFYDNFIIISMKPERSSDFAKYELSQFVLNRIVDEVLRRSFDFELFSHKEKTVAIIKTNVAERQIKRILDPLLDEVITRVNKFYHVNTSIGVSSVKHQVEDFKELYREASHALSHNNILGENRIFYYMEITNKQEVSRIDEEDFKQLRYLIRYRPFDEVHRCLEGMKAKTKKITNIYLYNNFLNEISSSLIKCSNNITEIYKKYNDDFYEILKKCDSANSTFKLIEAIITDIKNCNDSNIEKDFNDTISKAIEFMEANFPNVDLSLNLLADNMNLSVSYLCALFKKKKNSTFVKLLTEIRIEKAKELLKNDNLKIVDVAEAVGFFEPYYFSRTFKKFTSYSPKDYRNLCEIKN